MLPVKSSARITLNGAAMIASLKIHLIWLEKLFPFKSQNVKCPGYGRGSDMKMSVTSFIAGVLLILSPSLLPAATTRTITKDGVTFTFDAAVEWGTFADGSIGVVVPATVTAMTPDWTGTHNGWEINPTVSPTQGFYAGGFGYDAAKRPALPLTFTNAATLVKTIGLSPAVDHSNIKTAVALTFVNEVPTGGWALYFRPPYVGTEKPLIPVSDLRSDLLPSMPVPLTAPSLGSVAANFSKCLRMDHHSTHARQFRPQDAMTGYMPNNTPILNEAMLRLMGNESFAAKLPALIQFTQHALDRAYAVSLGYRNSGTGHNPNQRVLAAWGAVMLDLEDIKTQLETAEGFHEDEFLYMGMGDVALWGEPKSELAYWTYIMTGGGSRSNKDPYNYIDGGEISAGGASYQNIVSQSLKGQALIYRLFPQLRATVPDARIATLDNYAERWVTVGTWYSPDPAAPFDGNTANYGVRFGPNGAGSYIAGSGRGVALHGSSADGGQYKSAFVASMWDAYAGASEPDTPRSPSGVRVSVPAP